MLLNLEKTDALVERHVGVSINLAAIFSPLKLSAKQTALDSSIVYSAPQRAGRRLGQLHPDNGNAMEGVEPPVELGDPIENQPQPVPLYENRLSTPFFIRFPAATAGAFLTGAALGVSHGGKTAGMRFRAENSHRFPTTSAGWYLYHKSKNYHMMLGGIKEGLKMGAKVGFWAGSFFVVEEAVDEWRGTKDFLSTVVAGMTLAAGFSGQPWSVCPVPPLHGYLAQC